MQNIARKRLLTRPLYIFLVTFSFFVSLFMTSFAENSVADFTTYYQYPFALGLDYQSYTFFNQQRGNDNIIGLTLQARFPIPAISQLQPAFELGFIYTDNQDTLNPQKWDHTQYYGLLGLVYANHVFKNFELGVELLGGASYTTYPKLIQEGPAYGSVDFIAQSGLYLSLTPNYNFMLAFHPTIKYFHALTPLNNYNGFVIGTGLSVHYRFGEDPDRPQSPLHSLTIGEVILPPIYANMQNYYSQHHIGKVRITNTEKYAIKNIDLHFSQATYQDAKTYCGSMPKIGPGKSWEAELYATFNDQIFNVEGSVPINGEIIVTYKGLGRTGEQRQSVTFELNDKTTVIWNDYNKAAALITPADSVLKNYSSFIQRQCETETIAGYNRNLQLVIQLYYALTELNIIYQPDPTLPFRSINSVNLEKEKVIKDTVYLARDTLKRGSGDCDDLTVLFCSLLESIGIESGYIIIPGHMFPIFNTKEKARSFANLHPNRKMSIQYNGELWLPIELTLLGQAQFSQAWQKAVEQYQTYEGKEKIYITKKAWETYNPVGLRERDLGLQYGNISRVIDKFKAEIAQLTNQVLTNYLHQAQVTADKSLYNLAGSLFGDCGRLNDAEKAFKKALNLDANYLYARVNLAVLSMRKKEFKTALSTLKECLSYFSPTHTYPPLLITKIYSYLSQCYQATGEEDKVKEYTELIARHESTYQPISDINISSEDHKEEPLNIQYNNIFDFILE